MALITKTEFKEIMNTSISYEEEIRKLPEIINYDCSIFDYYWRLFDKMNASYFNTEGRDWINWWLWEKRFDPTGNKNNNAWDENGNLIPTETIDDLWELVKDYRI